jgi:methyl-accepting chemotaxis protein
MFKMRLTYKLFILIAIPLLVLGIITYISFGDVYSASKGLAAALYNQSFQSSAYILNAERDLYQAQAELQKLYYERINNNQDSYQKTLLSYKENMGQIKDQVAKAQLIISKNQAIYQLKRKDSGITVAQHFSNFDKTFQEWSQVSDALIKDLMAKNVNPRSPAQKFNQANALFEVSREDMSQLGGLIEEYAKSQMKDYRNRMSGLLIFSLGGMVLSFLLSLYIARSITGPLNRIIRSLAEGVHQVAGASVELSASSQQLSEGSSEQASSVEETSATLEETASMLQQSTTTTVQASQLSDLAKESADKGGLEMQEMMGSMEEIKKSSDQIGRIIKVIDNIAFQTNILALNAAIEAARAGEAGLGFAVVAEEVRNLAKKSAEAAKETTDIIEANIELSGKGAAVVDRVRNALNEITAQTNKVNQLMAEISAASQEQVQATDQITLSMAMISAVTMQNAATAEESAAAAEELNAQANSMKKMVHELSELVNGKDVAVKIESAYAGQEIHHGDHPTAPSPEFNDPTTAVVTPEDIIPLEKDSHHF